LLHKKVLEFEKKQCYLYIMIVTEAQKRAITENDKKTYDRFLIRARKDGADGVTLDELKKDAKKFGFVDEFGNERVTAYLLHLASAAHDGAIDPSVYPAKPYVPRKERNRKSKGNTKAGASLDDPQPAEHKADE
jgi:hypothetical protein